MITSVFFISHDSVNLSKGTIKFFFLLFFYLFHDNQAVLNYK